MSTQPVTETDPIGRAIPALPEPDFLTQHGPARIVSICNQKGGVGKTTTTINLAAALAECGRKVLIVDFDPQGAASVAVGVNTYELDYSVYDLLSSSKVSVHDVIVETKVSGLDIIPANIDLSAAEMHLVNEVARESVLARALRPVTELYDLILIDCQPSLGLLTVNALTASHGVLVPLAAEFFAMRGVALLIETIEKVRDRLNPSLELDGIVVTMFDARTIHSQEVMQSVHEGFGDALYHTVIGRTVKFPDATVAAEPITSFASSHPGAKAYRNLAREFIARGGVA